ncbi:hypothetical protein NX722_15870 [Endozoicomonas gorgoniicola]|uniref:Uncharacterized protein n=1 Tax=Endozoicomonas gorgoniicola TaxID=1234144 RepID=A0ABT3MXF8_9GAMM|nr:hypothetical protein [Endozoicomonas gorgoniicola]MCW7554067.1 hypothetical protein [Endozoicomonas gorgoniicola]
MPYLRQYRRIPLSFRYPVADSVLNCTASEYNITYVMPEFSSACLILTRVFESRFFILTTYMHPEDYGLSDLPEALQEAFVRFTLTHQERNHCLAMHRRNDPFATHSHFGLRHEINTQAITPLLRYILLPLPPSTSKSKTIKQFYKAVKYFIRKPAQPGIYFENGHYALKDGYMTEPTYPHGPYKLKKDAFSSFSGR